MTVTERTWAEYIARLARLNKAAGQKMAAYIAARGTADNGALIAYAYALVQKYGEGSAELACQMYDALAEASGANVPPAEPAAAAGRGEVAGMVNATRASPSLLQAGVSRLVKQAGADTTLQNALRDGAEFAWVPHGDTCAFCLTLASRGWQRAGKAAIQNGHAAHIHANCDCEYAVRFNSGTGVAGYDPAEYLRQYNAAGGDINAMRRARYAERKDAINAQKRAAYAAHRLREQASRGILNESGSDYLPITKSAIEAVHPFACRTLDEISRQALAEAHKQLLQAAAELPVGIEVACCYGLDGHPLVEVVFGNKLGQVRIPDQVIPYIAAHTHPSGLTFSLGDIRGFAIRENMRMLTAVGNDGHVYAIEKTDGFNKDCLLKLLYSAEERLSAAKSASELSDAMQNLLKEAEKYGISYYA